MMKKIITISKYDAITMFVLFGCAWLVEQILSRFVEKLFWGEAFVHEFDIFFTLALFTFYAVCANYLAEQITVLDASRMAENLPDVQRWLDAAGKQTSGSNSDNLDQTND